MQDSKIHVCIFAEDREKWEDPVEDGGEGFKTDEN
jgi:hypothetical protein